MKYLLLTVFLFFYTIKPTFSQSNPGPGPGEIVAIKIADKMKDTLNLTTVQKDSIYQINLKLHALKMNARQTHTVRSTLMNVIQQIENKRDSLYRTIISDEKYLLYKQKKHRLVTAQ